MGSVAGVQVEHFVSQLTAVSVTELEMSSTLEQTLEHAFFVDRCVLTTTTTTNSEAISHTTKRA